MRAVLNFAKSGWYPKGALRLAASLRDVEFKGYTLFFSDEDQLQCPRHATVPYAFKPAAFRKAANIVGRDLALLWCDSAVFAVRDIAPVFEHIEKHGYIFFQNQPHKVGTWTSDAALRQLNLSRDEAMKIDCLTGCCMGLCVGHELADEFLRQWVTYACDGISFNGKHTNEDQSVSADPRVLGHRHDQSIASVIAHRLGMKLTDTLFQYYTGAVWRWPVNDARENWSINIRPDTVLCAQGM